MFFSQTEEFYPQGCIFQQNFSVRSVNNSPGVLGRNPRHLVLISYGVALDLSTFQIFLEQFSFDKGNYAGRLFGCVINVSATTGIVPTGQYDYDDCAPVQPFLPRQPCNIPRRPLLVHSCVVLSSPCTRLKASGNTPVVV